MAAKQAVYSIKGAGARRPPLIIKIKRRLCPSRRERAAECLSYIVPAGRVLRSWTQPPPTVCQAETSPSSMRRRPLPAQLPSIPLPALLKATGCDCFCRRPAEAAEAPIINIGVRATLVAVEARRDALLECD